MEKKVGALNGIRIVELSSGIVGPLSTDMLALMGAQVIKIESRRSLELTRLMFHVALNVKDPDASPRFNEANLNKIGMCLDLTRPEGLNLAKEIIKISDAVVENYAAGIIDKLGLSYDVIKEINPDIVMLSASASGRTGPEAGVRALAPVFSALSGVSEMTGYADGEPFVGRMSMDTISATSVCFALLSALWHRQRTGQGQYIDYSSREELSCTIADSLMDYIMNGRIQSRNGNRDDIMAPHNCYPCQGDDSWISIAVGSDEEWKALCDVMGNPEWTKDERFADARSRWLNQEDMDKLLGEWTKNYVHYDLMDILQKAGVAAVPSFSAQDIFTDPHMASREFMEVVEHPKIGASMIIRHPWRLSETPPEITRHSPLLGEHNGYIIGDLMGASKEEIDNLEKENIFY